MLRPSCLTLEINEFRCYEEKIEENWQLKPDVSTPSDCRLFHTLYFHLITSKLIYYDTIYDYV